MKNQTTLILGFVLLVGGASCLKDHNPHTTLTVSTFAGSGVAGSADGTGPAATFNQPTGVAVDRDGNVYVADLLNCTIRKITPNAVVTTLAGSANNPGFQDGQGTEAKFYQPIGLAVDASGYVYVADYYNNRIRKISPTGLVTTLAGSGQVGADDGLGTAATFHQPEDLVLDRSGNIYVSDEGNSLIRKVSPEGMVTTIAGSGQQGAVDGQGTAASFCLPDGIALDEMGNLYIADSGNNLIRKIDRQGMVTTLAGSGKPGSADGKGAAASFGLPEGICLDIFGNLYVADYYNSTIRKVTRQGEVTTIAGSTGVGGLVNGPVASALFHGPYGVRVDKSGDLYVVEVGNNDVRKIQSSWQK